MQLSFPDHMASEGLFAILSLRMGTQLGFIIALSSWAPAKKNFPTSRDVLIYRLVGVTSLAPSIMSSWPEDDAADQALASGITKLPVELKIVILKLTVYNDRKLALELVAKSSLFKQW
jgi:hypothetical protein